MSCREMRLTNANGPVAIYGFIVSLLMITQSTQNVTKCY